MRQAVRPPSSDSVRPGMCPHGCPTNHGGPKAAMFLAEEWRDEMAGLPATEQISWPRYAAMHGRPTLGDETPPPDTRG